MSGCENLRLPANADTWLTGIALDLAELLKLRNARRAGHSI